MAWRPTEYLLEGELDNTNPRKVAGWMRFAGMKDKVTFDLEGNFHRDIRGAKIRFSGNGYEDDPKASRSMNGMSLHQTGEVGDITAGLPPADYVSGYCYIEWYSEENGRVVVELDQDQVEVIGRPIPACESDPISRTDQQKKMARFIAEIGQAVGAQAVAVGQHPTIVSDPKFSHWVIEQEQIVGEAHSVEPGDNGMSFAFVRLFNMPDMAEYGYIETNRLRDKDSTSHS